MNGISWPSRDATPSAQLPPSVVTSRVVFESQSGESCCVAVDPAILSGNSQQGLAILSDLAPGPATVTVAGFTTDFAPSVPGIVTTCTTTPASAAHACDMTRVAAPAFESAPLPVNIVAGVQTNIGMVPIQSLPFLFDYSPPQDSSAPAPVQFALTVVDAVTNIRQDSVQLEVTFTAPPDSSQIGTTPSPFRKLTKRVPLNFVACSDGSTVPCSPGGALELAGFLATGTAPELPEGSVEAHVTAENLADPPRDLDFRYSFIVLATSTATAPPTATPSLLSSVPSASSGAAAVTASLDGTPVTPKPGADARSAATAAVAAAATPTATPFPRTE